MKLTLQILDSGDTFYRPLEGDPLVVGSADDAGLRLGAPGVEPRHARIEPDGDDRYRIVDLDSETGTRVNGEDVAQWRLAIGDRIEVGEAVLVVGQRVARKATPADVLTDTAGLSTGAAELRRRRGAPEPRGRRRVVLSVGALAVVVATLALLLGRGGDTLPARWGDVAAMRRQGQVAEARVLIDQFRSEWAGEDAEKNARLDRLEAEVRAIDEGLTAGRVRLRDEARTVSRAEQVEALQQERAAGDESVRGVVARLLLSELDELRLGISRSFPGGVADAAGEPSAPRADVPEGAETGGPRRVADAAPSEGERFVQEQLAAIDALRVVGRYSEALETMRIALSSTAEDFAAPLREARIRLHAEADREMRAVVERARDKARSGRPEDVDAAIALLRTEGLRFPADGELGRIAVEQRELEDYRAEIDRRAALADAAAPLPSAPKLAELRDRLAEARRLERNGEFAAAAIVVAAAADALRGADPAYAASLDGRREDLELLGSLHDFVAGRVTAGGDPVVLDLAGRGAVPLSLAGRRLDAGGEPLEWSAIQPASLDAVLNGKADPEALLGAAVLAYRSGARDVAETFLGRAVKRDAALQPRIDGVISRGRGENIDAAGYRLVGSEFVAVREIEARKRAKELEKTVARVAKLPRDKREQELEQVLSKGPQELDALVVALKSEATRTAARIENDSFRRHWEKVAEAREALDKARAFAKELIFDEERYFYPYNPPAVSAEKASEYWKVQGEVDERVAAVRALWEGKGPSKKAPKKLLDDVADLDWILEVLQGFGERMPALEDRVGWVRALPRDEPLELETFAWDVREAREHALWRRVLAFNQKKYALLTRAEIAQVEITNAYRLLFGHRPLALNPKLIESTRGHAEEMSRLGYFSHFSPTPGRKTPFDRMKLAGYTSGVSENIANHPSAESAHYGWIHSSGHHRNLLMASHQEFAVGNDGRIWVQNFGRSEEYLRDPDWPKE